MIAFEDLLCDACLYMAETQTPVLISDMCERCRKKVAAWLVETDECDLPEEREP